MSKHTTILKLQFAEKLKYRAFFFVFASIKPFTVQASVTAPIALFLLLPRPSFELGRFFSLV